MAMVCPQCQGIFEQRLQCPTCDIRLTYAIGHGGGFAGGRAAWQRTPWGRILIGLVVSQGLFHGLRQASVAGMMAMGLGDPKEAWLTYGGLIYLQCLQAFALLVGGVLAGAGQNQGFFYGTLLGVWNGVLLLFLQPEVASHLSTVTILGQPLLHAFVGGVAGFVGSRIWRPLFTPEAPSPSRAARKVSDPKTAWFRGPLHTVRVLIGSVVAVAGALSADFIFELVVKASSGQLMPSSRLQAQLITWEISALAVLTGGAVAGATTVNGFKQGFAVGLGAGVLLFGIRMGTEPQGIELACLLALATVVLAVAGGAFGARILPPLARVSRRKAYE